MERKFFLIIALVLINLTGCIVNSKYAMLYDEFQKKDSVIDSKIESSMLKRLIRPDNTNIFFEGRIDRLSDKSVRFDWPGVRIRFRFMGTSCYIWLEDGGNDYNVYLDGKKISVLSTVPGKYLYSILENLQSGEHEVCLSKRTEGSFGVAVFKGIILNEGGSLLAFNSSYKKKIQFIGDSITCGYGNEGNGRNCKELRPYENNDLTYARITASAFDADAHIIAISGKGMVRNYGDKTVTSIDPLPVFYDRILQQDPSKRWDHKSWIPDAVVIALGANDFSTEPSPDEKTWSKAYEEFILKIRKIYPETKIFCVVTRIKYSTIFSYLTKLVEKLNSAGDMNIFFVQFPEAEGEDGGCDWHPLVKAHQVFADTLIKVISENTGWSTVR